MVWNEWPWPLLQLIHPDTSPNQRAQIHRILWEVRQCCPSKADGFTFIFHLFHLRPEDASSPDSLQLLSDKFEAAPVANMLTEYKFPRRRRHTNAAQGHNPTSQTIAAEHCLSEFRGMYMKSLEEWEHERHLHMPALNLGEQPVATRFDRYMNFIKSKTRDGTRLLAAAQAWRDM